MTGSSPGIWQVEDEQAVLPEIFDVAAPWPGHRHPPMNRLDLMIQECFVSGFLRGWVRFG